MAKKRGRNPTYKELREAMDKPLNPLNVPNLGPEEIRAKIEEFVHSPREESLDRYEIAVRHPGAFALYMGIPPGVTLIQICGINVVEDETIPARDGGWRVHMRRRREPTEMGGEILELARRVDFSVPGWSSAATADIKSDLEAIQKAAKANKAVPAVVSLVEIVVNDRGHSVRVVLLRNGEVPVSYLDGVAAESDAVVCAALAREIVRMRGLLWLVVPKEGGVLEEYRDVQVGYGINPPKTGPGEESRGPFHPVECQPQPATIGEHAYWEHLRKKYQPGVLLDFNPPLIQPQAPDVPGPGAGSKGIDGASDNPQSERIDRHPPGGEGPGADQRGPGDGGP